MKESINPTERAVMETVHEKTRKQLNKRVPDIDYIDHRRLTYLLIEDRIAAYKEAEYRTRSSAYCTSSTCKNATPTTSGG